MPQRQNFRGRPDNRFRYNGPPNRGGRGGFNHPPGGGFQNQRRDTPQHVRQLTPTKPNVNENKDSSGNNGNPATKQTTNVPSLMQKDIAAPATVKKDNAVEDSTKGNQNPSTTKATSSPSQTKSTPATPAAISTQNTPNTDRSGSNKRPNSGYQGNQQRGGGPNQGPSHQHQGGKQGGPNHGQPQQHQGGRFGNRGNQERRQQSRFSGPTGQGHFQAEPVGPPQPMDFGDDLKTETKIEKKFTGRCRLFVGNLPNETTDEEFKKLFDKFGEINEVFLNKQKMFGFIRLDTRLNAEAAKNEMDGATFKGRVIRVRFAAHGAALRVKNLPAVVSNELLEEAFAMFGEVERAIVVVDDRGKSTGEGIIEFARKPAAQAAIRKIKEGVFLLTTSTRPITVEPLEQKNDEDGLPEKNVPKNPTFYQEREVPPRFAERNSFEYQWGQRWKQQSLEEESKRAQLETQIVADREKLLEEVELARHDYHTMQMRQELLHRQKELERLEDQRKDLEARRQGMQRHREERFVGSNMMSDDSMMRQHQTDVLQGRGEGMDIQQVLRQQEEINRRDGQRQSRFDTPPSSGVGFNGGARSSLASLPAGGIGAASPGQQVGVLGGSYGNQAIGGSGNPRPLMEELHERNAAGTRTDFAANPKRPRRF